MISSEEGQLVYDQWTDSLDLYSHNPLPSWPLSYYGEQEIPSLKKLSEEGVSTATYVLFRFYNETGQLSPEYELWLERSAKLGYQDAIKIKANNVPSPGDGSLLRINLIALCVVIFLIGILLMLRMKRNR